MKAGAAGLSAPKNVLAERLGVKLDGGFNVRQGLFVGVALSHHNTLDAERAGDVAMRRGASGRGGEKRSHFGGPEPVRPVQSAFGGKLVQLLIF